MRAPRRNPRAQVANVGAPARRGVYEHETIDEHEWALDGGLDAAPDGHDAVRAVNRVGAGKVETVGACNQRSVKR